jgi:hypothetical protein
MRVTKSNLALPICLFGGFLVRANYIMLNSIVLLWLMDYSKKGVIESDQEAQNIYFNWRIISSFFILLLLFPFGKLNDGIAQNITIPVAFIYRAVSTFLLV